MDINDQLEAAAAFTPGKGPWYPFNRTFGGTHSNCGWFLEGESLLFPPGFDPRNVQPVASRYIDCAIRVSIIIIIIIIFINCKWVDTRWQWLFYVYTECDIDYY
jgi:hypothetical protein